MDVTWLRRRAFKLFKRLFPTIAKRYRDRAIIGRLTRRRSVVNEHGGPLVVVGAFSLSIGIARAAQVLTAALEATGHRVHKIDCSHLLRRAGALPDDRPTVPEDALLVLCVNPPQMAKVLGWLGQGFEGRRVAGYWWWELDRLPAGWIAWAEAMDEIWVSSRYVQYTFETWVPGKTVRYLPLPVPRPRPSDSTRESFGLKPGIFTVLVAFDLASIWARKNPAGAIEAFRRAFPDSEQAQLVLKVVAGDRLPERMAELRSLTADLQHVRILDHTLDEDDLAALIRSCDALLSLHRSEGLGLFVAEAMWLGIPVVATGWSGVMDMLTADTGMPVRYELVPVRPGDYTTVPMGATWAEPDLDHAAECLTRLARDPALRDALSRKAQHRAEQIFSIAHFSAAAKFLAEKSTAGLATNRKN